MIQSILSRADGIFLWVDLVTSTILESDDNGETLEEKLEALYDTPRELDGLFTQIFLKLGENERMDTYHMLSWMLFATRRMSSLELCFAMQFSRGGSFVTFDSWRRSHQFIDRGSQTERFIRSRSRGLLTIEKSSNSHEPDRVQFIHQTVPGFLLQKGLAMLRRKDPAHLPGLCNYYIALTCIRYLSQEATVSCASMILLRSFNRLSNKTSRKWSYTPVAFLEWINPTEVIDKTVKERARLELLDSYSSTTYRHYSASEVNSYAHGILKAIKLVFSELPLLEYAIQALATRLTSAEESQISQVAILDTLLHKGPQCLRLWYSFQDVLYLPSGHRLHHIEWSDFLQASVSLGLDSCIRELSVQLSLRNISLPPSCDPTQSLSVAALYSSSGIVSELIACGANPNARNKGQDTPLDVACRTGDVKMVTTLLNMGAKVNSRNFFGFTPLHYAAQVGAISVMSALLSAGAAVDPRLDRTGDTPMLLAVVSDQVDVVKLLMANGADSHLKNGTGLDCHGLAIRYACAMAYAALNPHSPRLPKEAGISGHNRHLLHIVEPINRAMTASPSPERQEHKRVQWSGRYVPK